MINENLVIRYISLQYPDVIAERLDSPKSLPDIFIPEARHGYKGLYLIFRSIGELKKNEIKTINKLIENGYYLDFCTALNKAEDCIDTYMLSTYLYCQKLGIPDGKEKEVIKKAS